MKRIITDDSEYMDPHTIGCHTCINSPDNGLSCGLEDTGRYCMNFGKPTQYPYRHRTTCKYSLWQPKRIEDFEILLPLEIPTFEKILNN